jgi:hypothetical protein
MRNPLRLPVLFAALLISPVTGVLAENSVEGVWQISRIDRDGEVKANLDHRPSMVIFTEGHYSFIVTFADSAMRAFEKRFVPTDEEKLKRFREVAVNSGTYKLEGSQLKTYPLVARDPELIGGVIVYRVNWSDDDLVLTYMEEYSYDGVPLPWIETISDKLHMTLIRVSE